MCWSRTTIAIALSAFVLTSAAFASETESKQPGPFEIVVGLASLVGVALGLRIACEHHKRLTENKIKSTEDSPEMSRTHDEAIDITPVETISTLPNVIEDRTQFLDSTLPTLHGRLGQIQLSIRHLIGLLILIMVLIPTMFFTWLVFRVFWRLYMDLRDAI